MSLTRQYVIRCDHCGAKATVSCGTYEQARAEMEKNQGWHLTPANEFCCREHFQRWRSVVGPEIGLHRNRPFRPDDYCMIPLSELQTPKDGFTAYVGYWWEVRDGHALAYTTSGSYTPQCNKNKAIVERLAHDGCEPVFIDVAFWDNNKRR